MAGSAALGNAAGGRTIQHNSSSRKASVTLFCDMNSRYIGTQNLCRIRSIAQGKARAVAAAPAPILFGFDELATRIRLVSPAHRAAAFSTFVLAILYAHCPTDRVLRTRPHRGCE